MRILVIGDVHGTQYWKAHTKQLADYDKVIFVGDYFDGNSAADQQLQNLTQIIDLKKKYNNKVELLLGNHDMAYLICESVSGHQWCSQDRIEQFLKDNLQYFNIAAQCNDWVISHAGISIDWMAKYEFNDIADINAALHNGNYTPFAFSHLDYSCCGEYSTQSPVWIRPNTLINCAYYNKQIVGHTADTDNYIEKDNVKLHIVDNMEHSQYLDMEVNNE